MIWKGLNSGAILKGEMKEEGKRGRRRKGQGAGFMY